MDFFRRRKRLVLGAAAGAAGAVAAYLWYTTYTSHKLQQQRSVEMELSAILRGAAMEPGGGEGAESGDTDGDADSCGSPDLDESLDSHFNYIQRVSAAQELTSLLPRLQQALFELTDVALLKQQQAALGTSGGGVQEQLRLLARLCFGRTVAAAFLLPLLDLCVRTKLNIIGRHLFLQEKFSKLRQPANPAARLRLPPRLTAAAVEAFLGCDHLTERGAAWLVEQAMIAVDRVLSGTPMDASVTPEQLAGLVQTAAISLGQAATMAGAASPTGSAWVDILVGPGAAGSLRGGLGGMPGADGGAAAAAVAGSAEAYRRALASASMVEELEAELRRVMANYRFGEALHAAVGQCLSSCAAHIHATFISQAAAAVSAAQSPPPPQPQAEVQAEQPQAQEAQEPRQGEAQEEEAAAADQRQEQQEAGQQAEPLTSPEPLHSRQEAVAAPPQLQRTVSPFANGDGTETTTTAAAPEEASPSEPSPCPTAPPPAASSEAAAEPSPFSSARLSPSPSPPPAAASTSPRSGGGARATLAAAAVAAMQPRPLARCLRAVQGACEPLFIDAKEISARIAVLPPVMSLCAVAFAAPLEL